MTDVSRRDADQAFPGLDKSAISELQLVKGSDSYSKAGSVFEWAPVVVSFWFRQNNDKDQELECVRPSLCRHSDEQIKLLHSSLPVIPTAPVLVCFWNVNCRHIPLI